MGFVSVNSRAFIAKVDIDSENSELGDLGEARLNVDPNFRARTLLC